MTHPIFPIPDLQSLLTAYSLGQVTGITPLTGGTVQTNLRVQTTQGDYVLRLYVQNRSWEAVLFEVNLIAYLRQRDFPCPGVVRRRDGRYAGRAGETPYALFEFVQGEPVTEPSPAQEVQLIRQVARLHQLTRTYRPVYRRQRWNYVPAFCAAHAAERAAALGTAQAQAKLAWYGETLAQLRLPQGLPKGVCHGDFHFSNVLFLEGFFHALLDFDDANITYLTFDLASLVEPTLLPFEWNTWSQATPGRVTVDFSQARRMVAVYQAERPLNPLEKRYFFDVIKLAILVDCLWFFERGDVSGFYERRKLECLDALGREAFARQLFG